MSEDAFIASCNVCAAQGCLCRAMGRHGRFDSKIFESAHHFWIESNRAANSNLNRISKLRRSLCKTDVYVVHWQLLYYELLYSTSTFADICI